jgi:hypothetical protein
VAGYVPLEIEQYSTFSRTITLKDAAGELQNLVGFYANTALRKSYYSTNANTVTTTISDPSNGEITLALTASETANLTPGRYVYDVVSTSNTGARTRLVEGIVVVTPGATH